jgi:hypothetical protein
MIELFTDLEYKSGFKYQNDKEFRCFIPSLKKYGTLHHNFIHLDNGYLTVYKGYAWDGASGPTFDTKSSMRGGFIHDVIYELLRHGLLPPEVKEIADEILEFVCKGDDMWWWRAEAWHIVVDKLADAAADPKNKKKVHIAP